MPPGTDLIYHSYDDKAKKLDQISDNQRTQGMLMHCD